MPKITVPIRLNKRCNMEALFAFLPAPALDISAVTQVPIFCPSVMKIADRQLTIPFKASVCKIPTLTDEL